MIDNVTPIIHPGNTENATEDEILDALPPENRLGFAFEMTRKELDLSSSDWMETWINTALGKLTEGEQIKIKNEVSLLEMLRLSAQFLQGVLTASEFCANPGVMCLTGEHFLDGAPYPTPRFEIRFGYGCVLQSQYFVLDDPDNINKVPSSDVFHPIRLNSHETTTPKKPGFEDLVYDPKHVSDLLDAYVEMTSSSDWKRSKTLHVEGMMAMTASYFGGQGMIIWVLILDGEVYDASVMEN